MRPLTKTVIITLLACSAWGQRPLSSTDTISVPNASSTGTTVNKLAKFTGAPSTVVITATTDTYGIVGVVVAGAGTSGNALVARYGTVLLAMDGATTAGHYVIESTGTAGDGSDGGSTCSSTSQVLGIVTQTIGSAGNAYVTLGNFCVNGSGGGGVSFPSCHAYTYTSGTLTVDFSTYTCAIVTASGANPTLAFTAPSASAGTPLTLGLCNDTTARVWTLPATAKQFGIPLILSTCIYNEPITYDGTNYQAPGSNDTPSIINLSAVRAAPAAVAAGGALYPNSSDSFIHYINPSNADYRLSGVIAKGTVSLATSAIASGACQTVTAGSVNSVAATGAATTDTINWTPNGSLTAVTGYTAGTSGGLSIVAYPTSGYVNWDVCNWSASTITPGAVILNWKVTR